MEDYQIIKDAVVQFLLDNFAICRAECTALYIGFSALSGLLPAEGRKLMADQMREMFQKSLLATREELSLLDYRLSERMKNDLKDIQGLFETDQP